MPIKLGSQFIDVGFDQAVPPGQALGMIYEPADEMLLRSPAESYSSYQPLIPRSEWKATADIINPKLRQCIRNVKNQGSEGSCVFNAVTGMWEFASVQQYGWDADHRILSAIIGYSKYGSSAGSGSYVGDAVKFMIEEGCVPEAGHGYTDEHQFAPTGFSAAKKWRNSNPTWVNTAANYMALEWYKVQTVEEWATALLRGHPIIKGRKGHSIFDFMWDYDEAGKWYGAYCNSWSNTWGDPINDVAGKGLGYDSEKLIGTLVGWALVGVKRTIQPILPH